MLLTCIVFRGYLKMINKTLYDNLATKEELPKETEN